MAARSATAWALAALVLAGCGGGWKPPASAIAIEIDFGPAGREPVEAEAVVVGKGTRTVLDLLRQVAKVGAEDFPGAGVYVTSIDGVAADPKSGLWWTFTVNGRPPDRPCDRTPLGPGDVIAWRYGPIAEPARRP